MFRAYPIHATFIEGYSTIAFQQTVTEYSPLFVDLQETQSTGLYVRAKERLGSRTIYQ